MNNKKERLVAAIKNGTVIDHIPAEKTYEVVNLLKLQELAVPVTIGYNYPSSKIGKKGIIKVSDRFFTDEEISRLSVVAPNVVLNIIKDYEVVEKKTVETPDELQQPQMHYQQRAYADCVQRCRQGSRHHQVQILRQRAVHGRCKTRIK